MKSFASFGIGSLGSISIQHTIGAADSDRPAGISADAWIRLQDTVGIVITSRQTSATPTLPPRATGYFVVKHDGVWLRLDPLTPSSPD
jgi:hypothetical protein